LATDEERISLAKKLREKCFSEVAPGIGLLKIPDRFTVKLLCTGLGIWHKVVDDLRTAKRLSLEEDNAYHVAAVIEADEPMEGLFHFGWVVMHATYEKGNLDRCEGVFIACNDESVYENAGQTAVMIAKSFLC
jgi:hypothetical protein